jgi:DNA-binding IclR family transcriptional regulator
VGSPILNEAGAAVAALSVASWGTPDRVVRVRQRVTHAADEISQELRRPADTDRIG